MDKTHKNTTDIEVLKTKMTQDIKDHAEIKKEVQHYRQCLEDINSKLTDLKENYIVLKTKLVVWGGIAFFLVGIAGSVLGAYIIKFIS